MGYVDLGLGVVRSVVVSKKRLEEAVDAEKQQKMAGEQEVEEEEEEQMEDKKVEQVEQNAQPEGQLEFANGADRNFGLCQP